MVPPRRDPRGIGRKGGFKSLGSNLPQNAYKGKVEKIKEGLIHNAKVKRAYYRTLKREEKAGNLPSLPQNDVEELGDADLETLHPSRSKALARPNRQGDKANAHQGSLQGKIVRRKPTMEEKLALAEERRKEKERTEKERERKIKLRENKRKNLRKMTSKGQPVMRTRIEDLLGKVKKTMKGS